MGDIYTGWEPSERGAKVSFGNHRGTDKDDIEFDLRSDHLREFREDLEEAAMLSRGLEKVECFFMEIDKDDWLVLMGDAYKVESTLEEQYGWTVQFKLNTYSPDHSEITFPPDQLVTVWRAVE